ncbi:hypothetical protein F8388_008572 [Cannabis sativa]|uniref:Uncharacterized protein n=1 Tax=Cannabis sativa TaxID=3483 RepID=A0A7J6E6P2_CANSA|nr:hypothetical protein F8388_008572 [Cannabis sativa]
MWNPLSWVMEAATIMAIALANGGVIVISITKMRPRADPNSILTATIEMIFSSEFQRSFNV